MKEEKTAINENPGQTAAPENTSDETAVSAAEPFAEEIPVFERLGLGKKLLRAISDMGFDAPSPIQEKSIPIQLAGRNFTVTQSICIM